MENQDFSIMKSLFDGNFLTDKIFPFPDLSDDDKETLQVFLDSVDEFCKENINGEEIEKLGHVPKEILEGLGELGVFGITIPEEYGGSGLGPTIYSRVVGKISTYCASTAITIGAHQSIGYKPIILYGTEELKQKYLPEMATGEKLAAYAITEANAGSDNTAIKTFAELSSDEKYFTMNGNKLWITNGGMADVFVILAKTAKGQTMFVVDKDMGIVPGPHEDKLGLKASSTTTLTMEDVKIPAENVLGKYGRGFKVAMETLTHGRLGLAGSCSVVANHMHKMTIEQSKFREQFGKQIIDFDMVRKKIAYIGTSAYVCDAMTSFTSGLYEKYNNDISIEADLCKTFCTEDLWIDINEAMQVAAGNSYMKEYPYERFLRDNRINQIFEGTSEIQRLIVGTAALRNYRTALKRNLISGDKVEIKLPEVNKSLKDSIEVLYKINDILSTKSIELVKKYDAEVYKNQYITEKIADIVMYFYALLSTVSKTEHLIKEKGEDNVRLEILYCNNFAYQAKHKVEGIFNQIVDDNDEMINEIVSLVR